MSLIAQTPRVTIREFLTEELETYLNHFIDEQVTLHIPKRSKEERIIIFNNALSQYPVTKKTGIWGIFDRNTDDFIGSCLLRPFDDKAGILELGYSLEQKYWGRGIATEMVIAVVAHGFADTTTPEIVAVTTLNNKGSQRVLEKAGFKQGDNLMRNGEELTFFRTCR
ncbi:MAG: anhydro-N-acetylmuramic acid kinase [Mucilaginibacter sp.]|nr:anhydro-N-acetylmuramic acid kinase [Mucilaginibacter sp.]